MPPDANCMRLRFLVVPLGYDLSGNKLRSIALAIFHQWMNKLSSIVLTIVLSLGKHHWMCCAEAAPATYILDAGFSATVLVIGAVVVEGIPAKVCGPGISITSKVVLVRVFSIRTHYGQHLAVLIKAKKLCVAAVRWVTAGGLCATSKRSGTANGWLSNTAQ